MPLIHNISTINGDRILVWKDEETLNALLDNTHLCSEDKLLLDKYTVERRKKDLIIARHLLQLIDKNATVAYYESGKPYLVNTHANISISHTKDLVAIIYSQENLVAIDIEYYSERIQKVKHRFLSESELLTTRDYKDLILYWSAKETLFKLDKIQGIDFREDIEISFIEYRELVGTVRNKKANKVHYKLYDEWVMTYAAISK